MPKSGEKYADELQIWEKYADKIPANAREH